MTGVKPARSAITATTSPTFCASQEPSRWFRSSVSGETIEGEVKGGENLVIDGKVDGTIELLQHVLTVGPTGRVKAELSAKSVVVLGQVSGSIQASERVSIGETGSVEGAVSAPRLIMVDGAQLQGRVDV